MKKISKITRKKAREHLGQLNLSCELAKIIRHCFPGLVTLLKQAPDPRSQSYTTYPGVVLLMTRILSSVFYISSMRKTSEEFNSDTVIENIWELCGKEQTVMELPYWETINRYLEKPDHNSLQEKVHGLRRRLISSRTFENARIRGKYWQVIIDGTGLYSTRAETDEKCPYRIHNKGTEKEYRENYCYALEAKLVLHPGVLVSIMTEFIENVDMPETGKQDCERKACWRLMERLKKEFPRLRVCLNADSLYACGRFFTECRKKHWHYILRFKEGGIPTAGEEYRSLQKIQQNGWEEGCEEAVYRYDYVTGIDYKGNRINLAAYGETRKRKIQKGMGKGTTKQEKKEFWFITNLPVSRKNVKSVIERGRMRWKIENEGVNTQKNHGYHLEHRYSKNYHAYKNHYYLIQIGHMIAQIMEVYEKLRKGMKQGREQKHRRILEPFKTVRPREYSEELEVMFQIRFQ